MPAGQVGLGVLLVKLMYQAVPDLTCLEQAQLLQMIILADRYGVQKVLVAAAAAMAAIPATDLEWQTMTAVYLLPPGVAAAGSCSTGSKGNTGNTGVQRMYAACSAKLQLVLGDLELTVADQEKWQQLLALPHAALKQLLEDPGTRVASEHTVFHVIGAWFTHQQQQQHELSSEEVCGLLQAIRMQHCSQLYISTAMANSPLMAQCFTPAEIAVAVAMGFAGVETANQHRGLINSSPVVAKYPAWTAQKRPASATTAKEMQWLVPLPQLKQLFEQHLQQPASSRENSYLQQQLVYYQETDLALLLVFSTRGDDAGVLSVFLGVQLEVLNLLPGRVCNVVCELAIRRADGVASFCRSGRNAGYSSEKQRAGWPTLIRLGAADQVTSWAAAEAVLRFAHHLVKSESLQVELSLSQVL